MRKVLIYALCMAFVVSMNVGLQAVEKKQKETVSKVEKPKEQPPKTPPKVAAKQPVVSGETKTQVKKKYDDFIDNNKNGIDDRRENLKKTTPPKSVDTAAKKAPSKKTGDKKSDAKKDSTTER